MTAAGPEEDGADGVLLQPTLIVATAHATNTMARRSFMVSSSAIRQGTVSYGVGLMFSA